MKSSGGRNITSDKALIFDIQDLSVQDGPGIRTTVFMKGCPLKCRWCSNPEGQNPHTELMHIKTICKKHYKCISACPYNAVTADASNENSFPVFDYDKCRECETHECIISCPERALRFTGKYISSADLIKRVKANIPFYRNSGGGVTFSGGEPVLQIDFIKEFIKDIAPLGISVVVETCGMFEMKKVREIAVNLDFIYYDIKCMDSVIHKKATGSPNETILNNLKELAGINPDIIIVSVPVIPGVNDNDTQIKNIALFCKENKIKEIRLLPYHSFGEDKYSFLGRKYLMKESIYVPAGDLNHFVSIINDAGINCAVE
jgi:pyruvate formate lyase activating enzyme